MQLRFYTPTFVAIGALGVKDIMKVLPHRYPFLMVDKVLNVQGNKITAAKNVSINELFFQGHFPGHPVMPGVLILEAMAQVGGYLVLAGMPDPHKKLCYLSGIDKARFRRPVVPGDQIIFTVEIVSSRQNLVKVKGEARVDGQLCAEAEILSTVVDRPAEAV